jgi:hypothetical protein
MVEFTSEVAGRLARRVLFEEWTQLVVSGYLTEEGLLAVRTRLDPVHREFEPGPDLELLRLRVDGAIARARGIEREDMPGALQIPDDVSEIADDSL